jgi:Tfp pilus assembly protein PilN
MTSRLGLELGPHTIRAVHRSGLRGSQLRTLEISWDPEQPAEAFAALHEHLGAARHVFAAVDLALLHVKRLDLPPLPLAERRRILGLEPDRFFAVRGAELAFALREADALVFAVRERLLTDWVEGLARLGRRVQIEPGPIALTRALRDAQVRDAVVLRGGGSDGVELLRIDGGELHSARRAFGDLEVAADALGGATDPDSPTVYLWPWDETTQRELGARLPGRELREFPRIAELDPTFLVAYGATLADERAWRDALLTPELERRQVTRHQTRLGLAAAACLAALLFALTSVDAYRARAEHQLDARIVALRDRAGGVVELQERAAALTREVQAISDIEANRADLLSALLELSRGLPEDAWIRTVQAEPPDWYLDGWARDAAALIPLFENDPRFEDVQFRAATSRTQVGNETYDYFSLALRTVPAP